MALSQVYPSQTDVPEPMREHYAERDGRWILQTEPSLDHVPAMQSALNKERALRNDTEKQLTDMKVRFEGIDPDEVIRLRDRVKGLDDADVYDKQGIEALVLRRTESMKADFERQTKAAEREIAQLKGTVETTDRKWRQDRIKTALLDAVSSAGVDKPAIQDAVQRGTFIFSDLDEQGNVVARNDDTTIQYGKDGVHPLTPGEWIATLKASGEASHLWRSSSGGGAPVGHGGANGGMDWNSITNPAERLTRFREWQAAQQR